MGKGNYLERLPRRKPKFLPILNHAGIDLIVAGHTHRFFYHEPGESGNQCPVLEQGAMCATRLDLTDGNIHIKVIGKTVRSCWIKI